MNPQTLTDDEIETVTAGAASNVSNTKLYAADPDADGADSDTDGADSDADGADSDTDAADSDADAADS